METHNIMTPPAGAHRMLYRVPYSETDAMGRVYYANYLIWFERGRTEMLRDAGFPYRRMEEMGILLPVRQCAVRYLGFGEYDDEIELFTWITRLGRARVEVATQARKNGQPITVGTVELACVNLQGKPVPWPDVILKVLEKYLDIQTV